MIKKEKEKIKPEIVESEESLNSDVLAQLASAVQTILQNQQDLNDRLDDIEKKSGDGAAKLYLNERLFNTDTEHLPELTVIPLRAVRSYSKSMADACIMDEDVQSGKVSLATKRRNAVFQLMRSVKGNWGEKGMRLAEQQAEAESEKGEEFHAGQGF